VDPGFVGPEAYTIFGALFKKKYYEHRVWYGSKYLFWTHPRTLEEVHAGDWP
jgi:hypothetical protein